MPPSARPAFEIPAAGDRPRLVMVLLTVSDVLQAMRSAGKGASDGEIRRECVRYSLRKVGAASVKYLDLQGTQLNQHLPRVRHRNRAGIYWGKLHEPTVDERWDILQSMTVSVDGEGEQYTVTLPDKRQVTLREIPATTVEQALARARRGSQSAAFVELQAAVDALRSAVVRVGDEHLTADGLNGGGWDRRFSVKETLLLTAVLGELQTGEQEEEDVEIAPLGSESSASGT